MKLSLRWIFDHISRPWNAQDHNQHEQIVAEFNKVTAEIEHAERISWDLSDYAVGIYEENTLTIPEWDISSPVSDLPERQLVTSNSINSINSIGYLVKRDGNTLRWAVLHDFGVDKVGEIAPLLVKKIDISGGWRDHFETDDYIIDIDNKSITHRPDMWGHRGFAREIAAFNSWELRDKKEFLGESGSKTAGSFRLENHDETNCSVINGLELTGVTQVPSDIRMVSRFLKIGYRPINGLVDSTNYVMADWGHPMHAYDAGKIAGNLLQVRRAQEGEQLIMLDDSVCELTPEDLIIADSEKVLGLAGVMGGRDDSISSDTGHVLLEAACFHAATIRRMAARHKLRTESSQRFEKTLDPVTAHEAILRFITCAESIGLSFTQNGSLGSAGPQLPEPTVITLTHSFLESRMGVTLTPDFIVRTLESLEFTVSTSDLEQSTVYTITVPSFRATKDIQIQEDIVEEITRFYRFENITGILPELEKRAHTTDHITAVREIKKYCAHGLQMQEQWNYPFYDEQILKKLGWDQPEDIALINPVSQEARRLISSLIPHLCKNLIENLSGSDQLRYFEWGRGWESLLPDNKQDNEPVSEYKLLSGLWYEKRGKLDFYDVKEQVNRIFALRGIYPEYRQLVASDTKSGTKNGRDNKHAAFWADPYQSALISVNGKDIGIIGRAHYGFAEKLGLLPESNLFIYELDGDFLQHYIPEQKNFKPLPKYPGSDFDLSVLVPLNKTVSELLSGLSTLDSLITDVQLIDFFEKEEWTDKRSLAFRVSLISHERSLTRDEIERVREQAIAYLAQAGGDLRE